MDGKLRNENVAENPLRLIFGMFLFFPLVDVRGQRDHVVVAGG